MKLALLMNIINPLIGGVLIRGEKGTAKSTAVRALGRFLPAVGTKKHHLPVADSKLHKPASTNHENCSPACGSNGVRVVTLPLHATEDMVLGDWIFPNRSGPGNRCSSRVSWLVRMAVFCTLMK